MISWSIAPKARKYVKWYRFLLFAINISNKYKKQLLDTGTNASKKSNS